MERYKRKLKEQMEMFKGDNYYERKYSDPIAMRELELYLENDGDLYRQQFLPIIKNIQRKIKLGKYDHSLAPKLWSYFVENGAKKYAREFAEPSEWNQMFTKKDRMILSEKLADFYYDEIFEGLYEKRFSEGKVNDKQLNILINEYGDELSSRFKTHNKNEMKKQLVSIINSNGDYDKYLFISDKIIDKIDFSKVKSLIPDFLFQ